MTNQQNSSRNILFHKINRAKIYPRSSIISFSLPLPSAKQPPEKAKKQVETQN